MCACVNVNVLSKHLQLIQNVYTIGKSFYVLNTMGPTVAENMSVPLAVETEWY